MTATATYRETTTVNYLDKDRLAFTFDLDTPVAVRYHNTTADGYTGHDQTADHVTVMVCKSEGETSYTILNDENRRLEIQGREGKLDGQFRQFRKPVTDAKDLERAHKVLAKWLAA